MWLVACLRSGKRDGFIEYRPLPSTSIQCATRFDGVALLRTRTRASPLHRSTTTPVTRSLLYLYSYIQIDLFEQSDCTLFKCCWDLTCLISPHLAPNATVLNVLFVHVRSKLASAVTWLLRKIRILLGHKFICISRESKGLTTKQNA